MRLRTKSEAAAPAGSTKLAGMREPIGSLLVRSGVLSEQRVQQVLERQSQTGELFGDAAVALGFASGDDIRAAVESQQSFFTAAAGLTGLSPLLITAFDPDDPVSQEVRRLRGEISRSVVTQGRAAKSIALVGFGTDAERSVIAANLAVSFAQAGYRTLLVDAVLDGPNLHTLFNVPNRTGVSVLLSSDVAASEVIRSTEVPSLSLLAAGPSVPNISELFDRQRLFQSLRAVGDTFDMVLVEIGESAAEAAMEGAEAAVLVARRNDADLREVKRLTERLQSGGTLVIGSVLVD